jgi:hypothetical protein
MEPNPAYHVDADLDADPDPTFHFDADPCVSRYTTRVCAQNKSYTSMSNSNSLATKRSVN